MSKVSVSAVAAATLLATVLPARSQTQSSLPDGPGKETVAALCESCHTFASRVGSGYTADGWRTVIRMMDNLGISVPKDQAATVMEYLVKNFPEKPKPAGADIPGPVQVSIKVWQLPTPGSRPHDPLATRDGAIWYTGQMNNMLGRVDPKTGQIKEYLLKTPHTGPHGLTEDQAGNIWYTGNHISIIGKLDPKTGTVTEYKMPDPAAKDPHTLIFDQSGILWFTVQNANMIGRLDPKTSEVKLLTAPTPKSRPYGMAMNSKGIIFIVLFGTNKVARLDPKTMEIKEFTLPDEKARPRRIAITSDDMIWYSDFPRGYLGRLDAATGQVKEWLSPGGPKSEPYGISIIKDAVWYSESGTKPNTVVRFDPKTEKFQAWVIPGGGNIVRNTDVTPDGNFALANSLVNAVSLVEIK
jgi:virginiamycin B lyase